MSETYSITDRRPIATRQRRWAQAAANALARANVSPNTISIAGMCACLIAGGVLFMTSRTDGIAHRLLWLAAAVLVQLRLIANMLDGMVAVATGRASPVGELYNEVPDRISDAAALIGLGYAAFSSPALGYIATCLAIFTAYVRAQGKAAGAKHEFCGPMAKPHRMFIVTLTCVAMAVLPQRFNVATTDGYGIPALALAIIALGCIVTIIRRLSRIAAALRQSNP